ncbi:MAG TPA: hypothetical protein ENI33_05395 [Thermoplasmatales archaeon]|nr:hypothetical protein [Thermoplasmatales archaeon]
MRGKKVDIVFSGHDHIHERAFTGNITYIVTGGEVLLYIMLGKVNGQYTLNQLTTIAGFQ